MNKSVRHGIGTTMLCALVLAGCHSTTQSTKKDAATDARDGGADRAVADADAPTSTDLAPDNASDVAGADGRETPAASPETLADTPGAADAPADGLVVVASLDGNEAGASQPDAAIDVVTPPDAPPTSPSDAAADTPDTAQVPVDGAGPDRPATAVDAPELDASHDDASAGNFRITVVPNRSLDLVFAIDNSPSMAPKQAKLKAQFPKLIDALKDPGDGTLPDLRLAIIDSDLGTGAAYGSGSCGPKTLPDGTESAYGDLGRFQMIGATACGVTSTTDLWLEHKQGQPVNYTGDIGDVFTCLATNLGTLGCGEEHSLQAFEFALAAHGVGNEVQQGMLRPNAYLGLVFLTDEEDCSAATDDGIFGDKAELRGESASLRCSTRSHLCNGRNLTDSPPGYPTDGAFTSLLTECAARTDDCPNPTDGTGTTDTSVPTTCSPLKSIHHLATELKALKSRPEEQILVAGIFGWPLGQDDMASATYKIASVPNPNTADTQHPTVFDVWPICYDPNHLPSSPDSTTGFDATAAGWGATPGLRLSAFVDEFGGNGLKFSICQPDFSVAMLKIGATLAKKPSNLCVAARTDDYAGCTANYLVPDSSGNLVRDPTTLPLCNGSRTNKPCYALVSDAPKCPGAAYEVQIVQGIDAGSSLPSGTMLEFTCN
jgi:hypothetical protein